MMLESIAAIGAGLPAGPVAPDAPRSNAIAAGRAGAGFMAAIEGGIARADASLHAADAGLRSLAAGEAIPLHDVMIAMEQARIDLTLIAEVRNRIVEGYQELVRMQL